VRLAHPAGEALLGLFPVGVHQRGHDLHGGGLAGAVGTQQRERRSRADLQVDAVKDDLPPNDLRSPVAVIALVMLLLSPSPRPGGRDHVEGARSGIHRGFTAVSFAGPGARRSIPHE